MINEKPDLFFVFYICFRCYCGELPDRHEHIASYIQEHFLPESSDKSREPKAWIPEEHITKLATNGFGKIEFSNEGLGGRKPAKVSVMQNLIFQLENQIFL